MIMMSAEELKALLENRALVEAAVDLGNKVSADIQILELALFVVSRALDDLVDECTGSDGKPKAPKQDALMRARAMLPPRCKHAFRKG